MQRIRLAPEFECYPTWLWSEKHQLWENVHPKELIEDRALVDELLLWDERFQAILDHNYPPDSKFPSPEEEVEFRLQGARLAEAIRDQLGRNSSVEEIF